MSEGHIVYSNTSITDADGVQTIDHHTRELYIANVDTNHWIEVKLNGKHSILIPDANNHVHPYVEVPGDYNSIEVITASSEITVFAVG